MTNEQILKRLQDTMTLFSTVLEQLEALQWIVKDTIEDLVLALNDDAFIKEVKEESEKPSKSGGAAEGVSG